MIDDTTAAYAPFPKHDALILGHFNRKVHLFEYNRGAYKEPFLRKLHASIGFVALRLPRLFLLGFAFCTKSPTRSFDTGLGWASGCFYSHGCLPVSQLIG